MSSRPPKQIQHQERFNEVCSVSQVKGQNLTTHRLGIWGDFAVSGEILTPSTPTNWPCPVTSRLCLAFTTAAQLRTSTSTELHQLVLGSRRIHETRLFYPGTCRHTPAGSGLGLKADRSFSWAGHLNKNGGITAS